MARNGLTLVGWATTSLFNNSQNTFLESHRTMNWKEIGDVAVGFWPLALTYSLVPLALYFRVGWIGAVVLTIVLCLPRFWWSCVFGLLNWITMVTGIAICLLATMRSLL